MKEFSKYVRLDVHKETIALALAGADGTQVRYFGQITHGTGVDFFFNES